jgi:hypothetical protein
MAKFLTYDINQVIINNNLFPANSISFQLGANTVPVKDIYGNLLYYSPTSPIQGSVSINFFLTGAIPSYLRLENQNEIANTIAFNQLSVPGCHLTNLSFSVRPFEPIPVKADFVFYHGIRALNTNSFVFNSLNATQVTKNISSLDQSFNSGLNILNGMSSYIITDDRSTYIQNPADFVVTDFDYQFSVERVPILRVGEYFPLRVAMKEINAEFNITASNLDGVLDIKGNSAVFSAVLKDNTDANVSDTINVTGIIVNQSYEISEDNFGFSKIKMMQSLNKKRSSITIPMEVNNPNIVNPPTNNNNVIILPPTSVTSTEIINSTKPDPEEPNKGTGTSDPKPPVDNTIWYYISVVVNCIMVNAENAGCNTMRIGSIFEKFFYKYNQGGMRFEAISTSSDVEFKDRDKYSRINGSTDTTKQWNYVKLGSVLTLKVNKEFLDNFLSTDDYIDNVSNVFISYKGIACNAIRLNEEYPMDPIPHTYGSFFRGDFFNALDDIYKNKNTPYIHNISINLTNNDCNIYANYYEK